VSHPDPAGPADLRPFRVGDELQNPVTGEFADTIQFRSPLPPVQKALFGVLAPMAQALGYRGTYAQISRSIALRETPEGRPALSPG
jgi:hypothetical protein